MGLPGIDKVIEYFVALQTTFAVIFGMCLQFFLGDEKTIKVFSLIVASSLFLAFYVMPMFVAWVNNFPGVNIMPGDDIYTGLNALSALLSMEILAILIKILPQATSTKLKALLGVKDD